MTSRASKLLVAALLASSVPVTALAHDCDRDRGGDRRPVGWAEPAVPPPAYDAPASYPVPPPAQGWREDAWRERRVHELREELRELEGRRAEVYASARWNPRRLWRLDRWYAARRAELERRLSALAYAAWR